MGSSRSLPLGLAERACQLRSVGGQGQGMPRLGLYLQGLEEVQGVRLVGRDEAEGSIGERCPRVGPKEVQEGYRTGEA